MRSLARTLWHAVLRLRRRLALSLIAQVRANAELTTPLPPLWRLLHVVYLVKRYIQETLASGPPTNIPEARYWKRQFDTAFVTKLHLWATRPVSRPFDLYGAHTENNRLTDADARQMRACAAAWSYRPLVSVIVPIHNATPEWLGRLVASVLVQTYDHWELILVDDASPARATQAALQGVVHYDRRIRVERQATNGGVSRATNRGVELANGAYLAFVDHDDELLPDALWWLVERLQSDPDLDLVYTDEEMAPENEGRAYPAFKPDFSPELLTSYNYICHLLFLRKSVFEAAGGLRPETDGAQDFDLVLRVIERTRRVGHIPRVLYRWHVVPRSISRTRNPRTGGLELADNIDTATYRVVQEHLDRMGAAAHCHVQDGWALPQFQPVDGGKVSIIICTRDHPFQLWSAVRSIRRHTDYPNYEIVIVDNGSRTWLGRQMIRWLGRRHRVLSEPSGADGFNFARLNNEAAKKVDGDFVLFLNDDTRVLARGWLNAMVGYALMPGVGAVGARLQYRSGANQHCGVILGAMGWGPWHMLMNLPPRQFDKHKAYLIATRNWSALTAACLLTDRKRFLDLGGFDDKRFAVCFNDVDYCVRLGEHGLRCVLAPQARLVHFEGRSRDKTVNPAELSALRDRLGPQDDPYWNPNFSREFVSLAISPRRRARRLLPGFIPRVLVVGHTSQSGDPWPHWETLFARIADTEKCTFDTIPLGTAQSTPVGLAVRSALERIDYDVVVAHGAATVAAIEAANEARVPSIWHLPERLFLTQSTNVEARHSLRLTQALDLPYQVVFTNPHTLAWAQCGAARRNFMVIEGVAFDGDVAPRERNRLRAESRLRHRWSENEIVVLAMASAPERDGIHVALAAYNRLAVGFRRRHRMRLVVVCGFAPDHKNSMRLRRQVQHIGEHVEVIVEPKDVDDLLVAADIVVAHHVSDLRPNWLMKAMQFELPIVGTHLLRYADTVYPPATGFTVKPFRTGSLAARIRQLVCEPSLGRQLGRNGRHWLASRAIPESVLLTWGDVLLEAAELHIGGPDRKRFGSEPAAASAVEMAYPYSGYLGRQTPLTT